MTSRTFAHSFWGSFDGSTFTYQADHMNGPTITDSDGVLHLGENSGLGIYTYAGTNGNGDVVLWFESNAIYALLTDTGGQPTTVGGFTTSPFTLCLVKSTRISTSSGLQPIETLDVGSAITPADGGMARIKWIGRMTIDPIAARLEGSLPIKITAGAISEGMPSRDLFVSPDHAVLVDGHLVHASALVNGVTIIKMEDWDGPVEYYHIETEKHELIIAEGLPAETFIDNVSREQFDNYAEYEALYPNAPPMEELDLPRVMFRRQLPKAIAKRLDARIDALMGPRDRSAPSTPALPAINLREPVPSVHV